MKSLFLCLVTALKITFKYYMALYRIVQLCRLNAFLGALVLLVVLGPVGQLLAKEGYNVWAKEQIRFLHSKVQRDAYNPKLRVLMANAYYKDGQNIRAEKHLLKALELQPGFAEAHCNLGVILQAQSRLTEAKHHYQKALEADSIMVEALAGLGTLLCRTSQQKKGFALLEKALLLDPERSNARFNLAVAYHKTEDYLKAASHFKALLAYNMVYPGAKQALARAYYSHGLVLLQAKQFEMALSFFDKMEENEVHDQNVQYARGLAYLSLEQFKEAEIAFKETVRLQPDHVPALHNLATLYDHLDRVDEARTYYLRVGALAPHLHTIEAARNAQFGIDYLIK